MDKNQVKAVFLLILLSLIWGSSFILIKKGLSAFSAAEVGAFRVAIAAVFLLPYLIKNFKSVKKALTLDFKYILLFAFCEIGAPPFLYAFAQTQVDSSTAGILNSLTPLFTLVAGFVFFKVAANKFKIIGVVVGLIGAAGLILFREDNFSAINISSVYGTLIVLATFLYGVGGNVLKERLSGMGAVSISALSFLLMGIPSIIFLFANGSVNVSLISQPFLNSLIAVAILSIVGSALAIIIFSELVKLSDALFASFVTYLIPFVAMLWGYLDNEPISVMQILALALILMGIYSANKGTN